MKLASKINLMLIAIFTIALVLGGLNSYYLTTNNARLQVADQAELIMQEALAVRSYTVNELRPLLTQLDDTKFYPQTVPAYAASQTSNLVRKTRPNYSYKEAVLNPTNPRDKASTAEEEIIQKFIDNPGLTKQVDTQILDGVKTLYISHPIIITNAKCLACHSTPENAPKAMRAIYGDEGGFGWKLNEVIGTQIVRVPYTLPEKLAKKTFISYMVSLALLFSVLVIVINVMLRKLVLVPVARITHIANEASKGKLSDPEVDTKGKDEIAEMARAFNRMRRSLIKLVQIIKKTQKKSKPKG